MTVKLTVAMIKNCAELLKDNSAGDTHLWIRAYEDSYFGWLDRIGNGKPEHWAAVMTVWRFAYG